MPYRKLNELRTSLFSGLPPGYTSSKFQPANKGRNANNRKTPQDNAASNHLDDDERKKASLIKKKLKDIRILKEKLEKGDKLDKNQLNKIASEGDLNKELAALKV